MLQRCFGRSRDNYTSHQSNVEGEQGWKGIANDEGRLGSIRGACATKLASSLHLNECFGYVDMVTGVARFTFVVERWAADRQTIEVEPHIEVWGRLVRSRWEVGWR